MRIKAAIHDIFVKHTNRPIEKIQADSERDYFMSANEAKEYGIVDKVITVREFHDSKKK